MSGRTLLIVAVALAVLFVVGVILASIGFRHGARAARSSGHGAATQTWRSGPESRATAP